jgi:hypothetical protein
MWPTNSASTDKLQTRMYQHNFEVDIARDELLDNYENVLRGKGDHDHAPSCFPLATWDPLTDGCPRPVARTYGEDDIQVALVFYSTFEQLDLPGSGPMDKQNIQKYYERLLQRKWYRLGIEGYLWYILSRPKPTIFVIEATKISQGYLNLKISKMG